MCLSKKFLLLIILLSLSLVVAHSLEKDLKNQYYYFNFKAAYFLPHAYGSNNNKNGFSPSFVIPNFNPVSPHKSFNPSIWGGVKIIANFGFYKFFSLINNPDSLLFKNNGIDIDSNIGLSPITFSIKTTISFTPIAFFNLYITPEIGFGWTLLEFTGVGVSTVNGNYSSYPSFYFELKNGGRFQFNFNAIFNNDWTHVIIALGTEFSYLLNPHAKKDQLWKYKGDDGKNINGGISINPYALLLYNMPKIPLKTVGILYEGKTYIGQAREISKILNGGWGSDFFTHNLSLLANFEIITPLTLGFQFKFATKPYYTKETAGFADISKRIATKKFYFYYDSIGLSLTYKF